MADTPRRSWNRPKTAPTKEAYVIAARIAGQSAPAALVGAPLQSKEPNMAGRKRNASDAAVAEELRGDPLSHAPLEEARLIVKRQGEAQIRMGVQVDEAGGHDATACVDTGRFDLEPRLDGGDPVTQDADVGPEGGAPGAVDDLSVGEDQIQSGLRVSGRSEVVRPGARSNGNDPC